MTEEDFFDLIDPVLIALGASREDGEDYRSPPLDVPRYYRRPARLGRLPVLGRATSVVAVARQPTDLKPEDTAPIVRFRTVLTRMARAANGRFRPSVRAGLALGLTGIVLSERSIDPDDEATLARLVDGRPLPRQRAFPLGLIVVDLARDSLTFALASGPPGAFPEPVALADALSVRLRRFVSRVEW